MKIIIRTRSFALLIPILGVLFLSACGDMADTTTSSSGGSSGGGGGGAPAGPLTLTWDAVNDSRVTGYKVYYSAAPFSSTTSPHTVDVGSTTTYTLTPTGLRVGDTIHVAVAAVGNGMESPLSDPVSMVLQ